MIYFVKPIENAEYVKIGYTSSGDAAARLAGIQTGYPEKLEVWYTMPGEQKEETRLHHIFHEARANGEWFRINKDIITFLSLPVYDQIAISCSSYGNRLHDAALGVYLGFDGSDEKMVMRMACLIRKSNMPADQTDILLISQELASRDAEKEMADNFFAQSIAGQLNGVTK